MTLEQFIATYNGKYALYPGQPQSLAGQCVQLVELYASHVLNSPLPIYPDAKDYWTDIPGFSKVFSPQPGDIGVYNGHDAFPQGHINIFVGGQWFEQNADPDGSPAHLAQRANTYLLGYLRKEVMDTFKDANDVRVNGWGIFGYDQPGSINGGPNPALTVWVGQSKLAFFEGLGPEVMNDKNAQNKIIANLEAQASGTYTPYTGTLYVKS